MTGSRFEFCTPGRIVFGRGCSADLAAAATQYGTRGLIVTSSLARLEGIALPEDWPVALVRGEPAVEDVRRCVAAGRDCDVVLGIGGGSPIDAAKAAAVLLTNGGDPLDYMEVVGAGRTIEKPGLPLIAVPTTAGAGAEATRNAVIKSTAHRVKASIRGQHLFAKVVLVDPALTRDLPPAVTAATGMDALTQLIEPLVSPRCSPMVAAYCREGIPAVDRWLRVAVNDGSNLDAREGMSLAALLGGIALANAGLGAVHAFAAPIGGEFDAPHGAVCGALLPHAIRVNVRALRERDPGNRAIEAFGEASALVNALLHDVSVPPLGAYGIRPEQVPGLCQKAAVASSMKTNPVALTPAEMSEILTAAL
ncbi:MAG: iron-containing alcohol dehydrogenase [Acidobacteria bacterium]|nr:iron-containing alcohol dehydrogenase [Acidobacteriota bacterium]